MFTLIIIVHVLACCLLILIVLVQQGKGGGLIDSFSSAESIFGTKTNTFLVKATSFLSVVFFITCLSLAFLSIQRNKSLTETSDMKKQVPLAQAGAKPTQAPVPTNTTATTALPPANTPVAAQNTTTQIEK
ncbi:MAG: preprotein translocase subunit SecG [Candidatus Omnitrophica bacterium CG1_02_44_16]|nr:MAG: preprotein translocase subunit SecG [Candidatus Omnitrophica bacterium CG1_02_44_16]PIZ83408.1 MAG: preprotein translocase subunit SecG [Candidatus Omnitrophica bacterium CG_4_10_14_0_2_um_filter_44_9]